MIEDKRRHSQLMAFLAELSVQRLYSGLCDEVATVQFLMTRVTLNGSRCVYISLCQDCVCVCVCVYIILIDARNPYPTSRTRFDLYLLDDSFTHLGNPPHDCRPHVAFILIPYALRLVHSF